MTKLLEQAFSEAARLSAAEQDVLAARLLAEFSAEDAFDHAIAKSGDKLSRLAVAAIAEDAAGLTQELDPERL